MNLAQGLMAGRSHLIFIAAILTASFIILEIEGRLDTPAAPTSKTGTEELIALPERPMAYSLDLDEFESAGRAGDRWARMQSDVPELRGLNLTIRATANGVRATLGPVESEKQAATICDALVAKGWLCKVRPATA